MIETVAAGFSTSIKYCAGSGASFFIANALPEESLLKAASAVTGWALAIVCIWTLAKTVKFLYAKIEDKDLQIKKMNEEAITRADQQRADMLQELQQINRSTNNKTN